MEKQKTFKKKGNLQLVDNNNKQGFYKPRYTREKNMNVNLKCSNEMKTMDPYRPQIWLPMK